MRVADVPFHSLIERRVVTTQVHLRIEAVGVPRGVVGRRMGTIQPEQIIVNNVEDVLALEGLVRCQGAGIKTFRLAARLFQPFDFLRQSVSAEVGHLTVVLVAAVLHGEEGIRLEIVLNETGGISSPRCLNSGVGVRRGRCRGCRCRLPAASGHDAGGQHEAHRTGPCNLKRHAILQNAQ